MVSRVKQQSNVVKQADLTIYGNVDRESVDAIDRVAEQMLMPRSWVVTQILREWAERRSSEIHELEQSWNGSYREELGRHGLEGPCEDCRPI
jgi:hypothetical protein